MDRRFPVLSSSSAGWMATSVFITYFCMYMYRKPFTAAVFEGHSFMGMDYKTILVVAQVLGYALSKVLGIKIISELKHDKRILYLLLLIGWAYLCLLAFCFFPLRFGPLFMFINGIPLGLVWGVVYTFCEGRRVTELITVVLSLNFILTSGVAKSLGRIVIDMGVQEEMMPAVMGSLFLPVFLFSLWMLTRIEPPNSQDVTERKKRLPMTAKNRKRLINSHGPAIVCFIIVYLLLTVIRDIRDNFAVEIWSELGFSNSNSIYSTSELIVTLILLVTLGLLYRIRNNFVALKINLGLCMLAILLLVISTRMHQLEKMASFWWMILMGIGLFVPYILLNGILFDRFIANFNIIGNVGFIMYMADSAGYLSSITVMILQNFVYSGCSWLNILEGLSLGAGSIALIAIAFLWFYVERRTKLVPPRFNMEPT